MYIYISLYLWASWLLGHINRFIDLSPLLTKKNVFWVPHDHAILLEVDLLSSLVHHFLKLRQPGTFFHKKTPRPKVFCLTYFFGVVFFHGCCCCCWLVQVISRYLRLLSNYSDSKRSKLVWSRHKRKWFLSCFWHDPVMSGCYESSHWFTPLSRGWYPKKKFNHKLRWKSKTNSIAAHCLKLMAWMFKSRHFLG